jgi:hypothetical protein
MVQKLTTGFKAANLVDIHATNERLLGANNYKNDQFPTNAA